MMGDEDDGLGGPESEEEGQMHKSQSHPALSSEMVKKKEKKEKKDKETLEKVRRREEERRGCGVT